MKEGIIIYILFFCLANSCDSIPLSDVPEYPVTYEPMGQVALEERNDEYQRVNDYRICSTLNEYGFTGYSRILFYNDIDPCVAKSLSGIVIEHPDSLVIVAKQTVVENGKFTNVYDSKNLEVTELLPIYGCTICEGPNQNSVPLEWKVTFGNQVLDGLEVYDTQIIVFVDVQGVTEMWGNWYPDFYAPDLLDIGYVTAQAKVVGESIDLTTSSNQDSSIVITQDMLVGYPVFKVVPYKNDEGTMEIRKAWAVFIDPDLDQLSEFIALVDVVDGTLLKILNRSIN